MQELGASLSSAMRLGRRHSSPEKEAVLVSSAPMCLRANSRARVGTCGIWPIRKPPPRVHRVQAEEGGTLWRRLLPQHALRGDLQKLGREPAEHSPDC